jgi:hypothetical protein
VCVQAATGSGDSLNLNQRGWASRACWSARQPQQQRTRAASRACVQCSHLPADVVGEHLHAPPPLLV